MAVYEVLLIAGRSGAGKSTVGGEVSELLRERNTAHCLLEGDLVGHVSPPPATDPHRSALTERNLAAVWANFAALGHRRLVCTNTVSVLEPDMFRRAMGDPALRVVGVLLTATEATAEARLAGRERGTRLAVHVERSARAARRLEEQAPSVTVRVSTDGKPVRQIAQEVVPRPGGRPGRGRDTVHRRASAPPPHNADRTARTSACARGSAVTPFWRPFVT